MTKYYCKQCDPDHHTILDETWVHHSNADGSSGEICIFCKEKFVELERETVEQLTPTIKFKGAGWASKDIKYEKNVYKALEARKYNIRDNKGE